MSSFLRVSAVATVLALSGCYHVEVTKLGAGGPGVEQSAKVHTLIGGLVALNKIDASSMCGDKGVWAVETQHGFIDMVISALTMGIYAPVSVQVTCKG